MIEYRGKRALMMLRVSTEEQKKKYGFQEQESEIREKLIKPLGLELDEENHIIKDAYTGMVFKNRPALVKILEMAEKKEFDVLVVDRLDRLGRKGLQRELYRAELKLLGVSLLSTRPDEHADDDTIMGEMIRILHGFNSEQERNTIVRNTTNGRKERVKEGKLLPGNKPRYGWKWADPEVGGKSRYVYKDEEKKVVERIYNMLDEGVSLRQIGIALTDDGIPTPNGKTRWSQQSIHDIATHPFYKGEVPMNRLGYDKSNGGRKRYLKTDDELLTINNDNGAVVPPIVTPEQWDRVQEQLLRNKNTAPRNNENYKEALLRCGLIVCGHCGRPLAVNNVTYGKNKQRRVAKYSCRAGRWNGRQTCPGGTIMCIKTDKVAWDAALELIRKPEVVDAEIEKRRTPDPTARTRTKILADLAEKKRRQQNLQMRLSEEMEKDELDNDTVASLKRRLQELKDEIKTYEEELKDESRIHEKWKAQQEKIEKFHKFCEQMREKTDDPSYTPTYREKRDALEFLGIKLKVSNFKGDPKIEIMIDPPSLVSRSS